MSTSEGEKVKLRHDPHERALFDRRGAFLGFLAKRLGDRAQAEDVLQEFSMRVLARKDQLRDAERLDAWLYAVLRSCLNDHYRTQTRRNRLAEAVAREPGSPVAEPSEQWGRLCTCPSGLISELRSIDAELIRRIDLGEEDRATVAADLGLSRNTLGVRLHRARAALRNTLVEHCGTCCETSRDDCDCPPSGCGNDDHGSRCQSDLAKQPESLLHAM